MVLFPLTFSCRSLRECNREEVRDENVVISRFMYGTVLRTGACVGRCITRVGQHIIICTGFGTGTAEEEISCKLI